MAGTITIIAGATYSDTITIYDSAGDQIALTSEDRLKFKIATGLGIADEDATFFADSDESGSELTIAGGVGVLVIPDSISAAMVGAENKNFKWQVRYISSDGVVNDTDQGVVLLDASLFDDEA